MNRSPKPTDDGMTVIELSVVMMLLTIVTVIAFSFVNNVMQTTSRADADVRAERDGQIALRTMMQDVRAANPLGDACGSGYATCLQFDILRPTSANPNCKSSITYRLASTKVVQDRSDSSCATNRSWTARPIIDVDNTASAVALFTYSDRVGQSIAATASCSGNPITAPCPKYAKAVTANLVVKYQKGSSPLRLSSVASVRNNR
jgi:prepilin-type N-terminal cleavage/methylation domain-containing protein